MSPAELALQASMPNYGKRTKGKYGKKGLGKKGGGVLQAMGAEEQCTYRDFGLFVFF